MAKSSRSKWKKAHRREKAAAESKNVKRRLSQLNKKLKITVKGGISGVAPQPHETRFHYLNPELDPRVPNTSAGLNNNYRAELNHVRYDYSKPLKLAPPRSNFYGKTDLTAPHPMTVNYDTVDADAPVAGHALTKVDMERLAAKQSALQALATRLETSEEEGSSGKPFKIANNLKPTGANRRRKGGKYQGNEEEEAIVNFDNDPALYNGGSEDEPEEFVLSLDGSKPIRTARKGVRTAATSPAAATTSSSSPSSTSAQRVSDHKIPSMSTQETKGASVIAIAGGKKVKKMTKASVQTARMASSTSKKKTTAANKKKVVL